MRLLLTLTSNDAEQEFMRFRRRKIRNAKTPLVFFERVVDLWKKLLSEAQETTAKIKNSHLFLTPFAIEEIRKRIILSKKYSVNNSTSSVYIDILPEDRLSTLPNHIKFKHLDNSLIHRFTYECNIETGYRSYS